jgi:CRISPR/Cas system-associated exonuclease Cas4 (RecB family)
MTSTSALLLEWDKTRPRSLQRQFGMSELGGCERRAGYRLAGTEPTNASSSVQAVMGTAIHTAVAEVLGHAAARDDLVEEEVEFAGILGHLDRWEAATKTLIDVKTTSSRWLEHIKVHGPSKAHLWQTHAYAAALIAKGYEVRTIAIHYLARDTGEEWQHTQPLDLSTVREALAWVARVRSTPIAMLDREYAPDSAFCKSCPFLDICWEGSLAGRDPRTVLYAENPDAKGWIEKLEKARADKADAADREETAAKALQALLPSLTERGAQLVDVGLPDRLLSFTVTYSKRLDTAAVKAEYAKTGIEPPYKVADKATVTVKLAARPAEQVAA